MHGLVLAKKKCSLTYSLKVLVNKKKKKKKKSNKNL